MDDLSNRSFLFPYIIFTKFNKEINLTTNEMINFLDSESTNPKNHQRCYFLAFLANVAMIVSFLFLPIKPYH